MPHKRQLIITLCGLMLSVVNTLAYSDTIKDMPLNGIGTFGHLGKDYYIVAHFSDQSCKETKACEQQNTKASYHLKVLTERWTSQSYSLVWRREMASNNRGIAVDPEIAARALEFSELAESQLTRGDEIRIAYNGLATQIFINNALAITQSGKALFNYIARVWIGALPPSKSFKNDLLAGHMGNHNNEQQYIFSTLEPSSKRLTLLSSWEAEKARKSQTHENTVVVSGNNINKPEKEQKVEPPNKVQTQKPKPKPKPTNKAVKTATNALKKSHVTIKTYWHYLKIKFSGK